MPRFYKANLYYKAVEIVEKGVPGVEGNETLDTVTEEVIKIQVCMPEDGTTEGLLTENNFNTIMISIEE